MLATALLEGAGRECATVGGVEFYRGQARVVTVDEATVRAAIESCVTWVWVRGSRTYHTPRSGIPPECAKSARPLKSFLLCGPTEEVISRLRGTWVPTVTASKTPKTVHVEFEKMQEIVFDSDPTAEIGPVESETPAVKARPKSKRKAKGKKQRRG